MALPDEILEKVDSHQKRTSTLRERMVEDYKLYSLERTADDAPADYAHYTSNNPKVIAKKIMSWITQAELIMAISNPSDVEQTRMLDEHKETFLWGVLKAGDMRLKRILQPCLREQMAFYATIRGGIVGRSLLRKRANGETFVDIMPWDILHTYWGIGSDGLSWACYRLKKTKAEIEGEYNVRLKDLPSDYGSESGIDVYDYYDETYNTVVIDGRILNRRTPHGSDRVPIFFAPVETAPMLQGESASDLIHTYMDSIYEENRGIYAKQNQLLSALFDLVLRTRDRSWVLTSRDGSKVLEDDPNRSSTEYSLAEGERLDPVPVAEMSQRLGDIIGLISGEIQRGSLPHAVYGELQFQLSGFALNSLKQGTDTALMPRLNAVTSAYEQITDIISDMYSSDRFEEFALPQKSRISPERIIPTWIVRDGCRPDIKLIPQLPEDDMTKITVAQMLREGPVPLADDTYIREKIMRFPQATVIDDSVKAQLGERMLPEAQLFTMGGSLADRGQPMLAQMYYDQLMMLYQQRMVQMQQSGMANGPRYQGSQMPGGGGGGGGGGVAPEVMSPAAGGMQPSPAQSNNANAGGPTPMGVARPGAEASMEQRLASMGLTGPRG